MAVAWRMWYGKRAVAPCTRALRTPRPNLVLGQMQERLNLADHMAVLAVLMNKIVTNLKMRSDCLDITEKTLLLLADLAGGYSSGETGLLGPG
eukprot:scaffold232893_cov30-Tisochrysis_lutea.AAC.5